MKRSILGAFVLVAAVALLASPQAYAVCAADTQPVAHGISTFIGNCPDANPVRGYIYALGVPTTNSGAQDVVCEANTQLSPAGTLCQAESGIAGDGNVTVLEDWGASNPTIAGCPNSTGVPGDNPVVVQVVCNNGNSLLYLTGYADFYTGYLLEMAMGASDVNVLASTGGTPRIVQKGGINQYLIHLTDIDDPADTTGKGIFSDCDATAQGFGYSCPNPGTRPNIGRGRVFFKDGPCGSLPDPRLTPPSPDTPWILPPQSALDAQGNTTATIDSPTTGCRYVGATQNIGGAETLAVSGAFVIVPQGAQADKFQIDGATFKANKLTISFSTVNEAALVGFNVYAGGEQLNTGQIPAQGGSKTYTFETTRGALKGNKAVALEGVFADGTKSKGPAFQVK
jgi:hypothetical protein